ncbi:hypothetical protein SAMN04487936_103380 [Halobacillus dabanensis]|uniref:Uncharacterized protein n=1 Tax=Halobacillus dabanensis TaxID=240302 RepID=A0A1I3TG02_HALDA|nr:hypothetical protein [Halobacillus dabanensis]SFJ70104.1 hypothetical protein SAMN04487936_103380 [Halobacillus dabanensis]
MKSNRSIWLLTFILSMLVLLAIYGFGFDFQFLKYEVNEKNQLVMYEGLSGPNPIINSDVSNEQESLSVLGTHMDRFNQWVLAAVLITPFFIASYILLFNEKRMKHHPKKKKYFSWTLATSLIFFTLFIFIWIRYIKLINEAYHNVLF